MVDKNAVKQIVTDKVGKEHIIPTLGVWKSFDDIDFNILPQRFVLKTTHGGGSTGIIICKDRNKFNYKQAKKKLTKSLKTDIYLRMREWPYKNVERQIIAEQYIEIPDKADLTDYKIFCFNGSPKYIQVIQDRNINETIDFFDTSWRHQPFIGLNPKCKNAQIAPRKPINLDEMLRIAKILSYQIPFVRVDLYNINGRILFGELTFYPASGFGKIEPDVWNRYLSDLLILPQEVNN